MLQLANQTIAWSALMVVVEVFDLHQLANGNPNCNLGV